MPAIGSVHKTVLSYGDATEESSSLTVFNGAVTAVSIGGYLTNVSDLQAKTDAITLGVRRKNTLIMDDTTVSNDWPTDPAAQRESKLLVNYRDTTTQKPYTLTIPTIDFSKLVFVPLAGDAVLFSGADANADIVAWVTSFETIARAPDNDTHTVEVTGMRYVGRNT